MGDVEKRFEKKQQKEQMDNLGRKARSQEDIEAEEELLKNTKPVEPIHVDKQPGRNDPCPCGSGKKYKKCHGAEK